MSEQSDDKPPASESNEFETRVSNANPATVDLTKKAHIEAAEGLPEKYEVMRMLGSGGMGAVFLAHDRMLDRDVAVKMLSELFSRDANLVQRFQSEARAVARLNHPNIVQVYEFGPAGKRFFIAMEYIDGRSLAADLEVQGKFSESQTLAIARHACRALGAAHAAGIIHRDVKPDNLMRTSRGDFKLVDLGLSKVVDDEMSKTGTGVAMGTPHYISPEQIRGDPPTDGLTDIYSLGAALYQLATGRIPFEGTTGPHVMSRHLHDPLPDPRLHVPELSPAFSLGVSRMMSKDARDRYQNALELDADLAAREQGRDPAASQDTEEETLEVEARQQEPPPRVDWDPAELGKIEEALAHSVGPMARVIVARTTQSPGSRAEIVERLSLQIPSPAARSSFLATFGRGTGSSPRIQSPSGALSGSHSRAQSRPASSPGAAGAVTRPPSTASTPTASTPAARAATPAPRTPTPAPAAAIAPVLAAGLRALLADRIGPLAGILVRRATSRGNSLDAVVAELAGHVPDGPGRAAFVAAARKLSAG